MSGIDYGLMERANQIVGEWSAQGEERTIVQMVHDAMVEARATLSAARAEALEEAARVCRAMADDLDALAAKAEQAAGIGTRDSDLLRREAVVALRCEKAIRALAQKARGA